MKFVSPVWHCASIALAHFDSSGLSESGRVLSCPRRAFVLGVPQSFVAARHGAEVYGVSSVSLCCCGRDPRIIRHCTSAPSC